MNGAQKVPWKRISVEAFAIVASILLAFAIDAWWDELQDRRVESADLERLHAEFTWNRERISNFRLPAQIEAASTEVYRALQNHLGQEGRFEIRVELLRRMRSTPTFDDATPVLDGLIQSGRLDKIRDQNVVLAISYWQRHIQQVQETDRDARQFVKTQLAPAFAKRANMGPTYFDMESDGGIAVVVDEELVSLVAQRAANARSTSRRHEDLKDAANDVIKAIEQARNQ